MMKKYRLWLFIIFAAIAIMLLIKVYARFNSAYYFDKGQKEMRASEYREAISSFKSALPGAERWEEVELSLIQAYRKAEQYKEAVSFLQGRMDSKPDPGLLDIFRCFHIADILHKKLNQTKNAEDQYKICIEKYEGPSSHIGLAEIYENKGEFESAIKHRERAMEMMTLTDTYEGTKNRIQRLEELKALYEKVGRTEDAEKLKIEVNKLKEGLLRGNEGVKGLGKAALDELIQAGRVQKQ